MPSICDQSFGDLYLWLYLSKMEFMLQTKLNQYDNSWYYPGAGVVKRTVWFFVNALFLINPLNPSSGLKTFWLRLFGAKIGNRVVFKQSINVKYPWNLQVGNYSWIGEKVWIDSLGKVSIGNNCCISQGALLLCGNHNYKCDTFDLIVSPIVIEDGVWIGANSVVCGGVVCCSHSVLSAMSLASTDLLSFSVYRGNPAVKIRDRVIQENK